MSLEEFEASVKQLLGSELAATEREHDTFWSAQRLRDNIDELLETLIENTDREEALNRVANIIWFATAVANKFDCSLEEVMLLKIEKLRERYGRNR